MNFNLFCKFCNSKLSRYNYSFDRSSFGCYNKFCLDKVSQYCLKLRYDLHFSDVVNASVIDPYPGNILAETFMYDDGFCVEINYKSKITYIAQSHTEEYIKINPSRCSILKIPWTDINTDPISLPPNINKLYTELQTILAFL